MSSSPFSGRPMFELVCRVPSVAKSGFWYNRTFFYATDEDIKCRAFFFFFVFLCLIHFSLVFPAAALSFLFFPPLVAACGSFLSSPGNLQNVPCLAGMQSSLTPCAWRW